MNHTNEYQELQGNREVKSTLFAKVFSNKRDLLSLYNALCGTNHENEEELEITTIEGILYMGMKNDVSLILGNDMHLYEHQSTYNPNMPLRGLMYFGSLYSKYVKTRGVNLYSTKLQYLPVPRYIVFYNGTMEQPDEQILYLSETFRNEDGSENIHGCLECEARMLNVNYGHNAELMEKCRRLKEYSIFVDKLRRYTPYYPGRLDKAITRTVDECIAEDILREFLIEAKAEVVDMVLYEFDRELYERDLIANTREDLREEVRAEVIKEVRAEVAEEIRTEVAEEVRAEVAEEVRVEAEMRSVLENIQALQRNMNLSLEEALKALGKTMDDYNKAQTVIGEKGPVV